MDYFLVEISIKSVFQILLQVSPDNIRRKQCTMTCVKAMMIAHLEDYTKILKYIIEFGKTADCSFSHMLNFY